MISIDTMNFKNLDLNLLRVLDALLETGSTTTAGQRIGLSQPAVSAALGRLRHALDDPLFVRQGRQLVPTDYAAGIASQLHQLLDNAELLLNGPKVFDLASAKQEFRIAGSDFFAELVSVNLVAYLQNNAPGICVRIVNPSGCDAVSALENEEIDLSILPATDFPDWIEHQPLRHTEFSLIASAGNSRLAAAGLSPGDTVPLDLFCEMSHAAFSPDGENCIGDALLAKLGRSRHVAISLPVFTGVHAAVGKSDLIALAPSIIARWFRDRYDLEFYQPPMYVPPIRISMIWHERSTTNPAHVWLRSVIAGFLKRNGENSSDRVAA